MDNNIYSRCYSDISHSSFSEDNNSRESTYGRIHESENYREHWRDSMKKRDRMRYSEKNHYRDRSIPRDCSVDENDKIFRKEKFLPQSIQQSSHFSAYNSTATNHSFVTDDGRTLTAMPAMKDKMSNREHRFDQVKNRDLRPDSERNHYSDRSVLYKRDSSSDKRIGREQLIGKLIELSSSTGYRLNIENCDLAPYTSRMHTDHAQACDDQYDACKQNALQYDTPHKKKDYYRQLTSPHQHDLHHQHEYVYECKQNALQSQAGYWEQNYYRQPTRPDQCDRMKNYDSEWNRNKDRSFLVEKQNPHDVGKIIREEQPPAQPIQQSSSFPAYNYPASNNLFIDNNIHVPSMMPNCNMMTPMNTSLNINPVNGTKVSQSNLTVNQNSIMPLSSGPKMIQTSNSSADNNTHVISMLPNYDTTARMNTPLNINPVNGAIVSQSNVTVNQNSIIPLSSGPETMQTSSADNNRHVLSNLPNYDMMTPMNTPQDHNPINSTTGRQSFVNVNQNSSIQTSNSSVDNNRNALSVMPNYNIIASMNINPVNCTTVSQNNATVNQNSSAMSLSSSPEITQISNLSDVLGTGNCHQHGMMASLEKYLFPPVKEVIHFTKCVLYPPGSNTSVPTTRKKPGCKAVVVDGLPEKITEEIIKEIFEKCGTVESVRISKQNSCFIQFTDEISVENAMYFSGYRIKIENKNIVPYVGKLYVDYAQATDDQYDYECKKRALQRQIRYPKQKYYKISEPLDVCYSDCVAKSICEKLKSEETFLEATSILITWLEKGECSKKTSGNFYSMIQSTYKHVRKLQDNKVKCEEQVSEAKKAFKKQIEASIQQIAEIEKVYKVASFQKCWDHFSKAQRKYIEMWKEQIETLKKVHMEAIINEQDNEECRQTISEYQVQDNSRSTSLPVVDYTDYEASLTCEKLKNQKTFSQAVFTLITWLERGECSEKTSGTFYSMIQNTHSNVLRLYIDKVKYEGQMNEVKEKLKLQFEGIIRQVMEIEKIFKAASLQKCWDHFTKAQRKNIEMWKKHTEELKNALIEKVINEREDEEMDLSDDENDENDADKEDADKEETDIEQLRNHIKKLQEELKHKDSQMSVIQTALQNSEKKILDLIQKHSKDEAELKELRAFKLKMIAKQNEDSDLTNGNDTSASSSTVNLENEARLFSLISSLFDVPSFSASMDHICHFLNQIDSSDKARDMENLMKHFLKNFKEKSCDIES